MVGWGCGKVEVGWNAHQNVLNSGNLEDGRGEFLTIFCSQSGRLVISIVQRCSCTAPGDRCIVAVNALAKLVFETKTLLVND